MKKLIVGLLVMLMLSMTNIVLGETLDAPSLNLPNTQLGTVYSVQDEEFKAATTATVLGYKTPIGDVEVRAGYVLDSTPIGAVTFKIGDLTQYGFDMPLHHLINLSAGGYVGYDLDESQIDYGAIATIIEVKF